MQKLLQRIKQKGEEVIDHGEWVMLLQNSLLYVWEMAGVSQEV